MDEASGICSRFDDDMCHQLPGGHTVVADRFFDPLRHKRCCLIEYLSPQLAASRAARGLLDELAATTFPDCDQLVIRLPKVDDRIDGFCDHLYYIRLDSDRCPMPDTDDIDVRPAVADDRGRLVGWLTTAFDDAMASQSHRPVPEVSAQQARDVVDDPDSVSFLALWDGAAIGHVTLLKDRYDPLTDRSYTELLDVLVKPDHPQRRTAEAALVSAAANFTRARHEPLIGHIVCGSAEAGITKPAKKILTTLEGQGWVFDHKFQVLDVDGSRHSPPTGRGGAHRILSVPHSTE